MADNIDFKNEAFQQDYMKPIAGEEVSSVWGRKIAANLGYILRSQEIFNLQGNYTQQEDFDTVLFGAGGTQFINKPGFTATFLVHYGFEISYDVAPTAGNSQGTLIVWVDGTQLVSLTELDSVVTSIATYGSSTVYFGIEGTDEYLPLRYTFGNSDNDDRKRHITFHCWAEPDWDSI